MFIKNKKYNKSNKRQVSNSHFCDDNLYTTIYQPLYFSIVLSGTKPLETSVKAWLRISRPNLDSFSFIISGGVNSSTFDSIPT